MFWVFLVHNFTKPSCIPARPSCGGEDTFLGGGCRGFSLRRTAGWWVGDSKLRGYSVPHKLVFALNIYKLRILKMFWAKNTAPEKVLRCFPEKILWLCHGTVSGACSARMQMVNMSDKTTSKSPVKLLKYLPAFPAQSQTFTYQWFLISLLTLGSEKRRDTGFSCANCGS